MSPEHVVEELAELTRDLQELLESYAPTWYTENLDTRVRKTLAMFNLPRRSPQDCIEENSAHS
jgi:hypothetical protein